MAESVDVNKPIQLQVQKAGSKRWCDVHIVHTTPRGLSVVVGVHDSDDIFTVINKANMTREYGYRNTPPEGTKTVLNIDDYKER